LFPVALKQITAMGSYHDVGERDAGTVLLMLLEVLRDVTLERTFTMKHKKLKSNCVDNVRTANLESEY
jgi:hypothetical protein